MSAAGGARTNPCRQPTRGLRCRAISYTPRTRSTRVLGMLEEIGKPYNAVRIARQDRRSPGPRWTHDNSA